MKILPNIPPVLHKSLLQTLIYKCYLDFINNDDFSMDIFDPFSHNISELNTCISFPDTLRILILYWPHEELILKNHIHSLCPSVDIFPTFYNLSQSNAISQMDDLVGIFNVFCKRLIKFIVHGMFQSSYNSTCR